MDLFSERNKYKSFDYTLLSKNLPLEIRNRLWNVFVTNGVFLLVSDGEFLSIKFFGEATRKFMEKIWDKFLKKDIEGLYTRPDEEVLNGFKYAFLREFEWYKVYDFIEFFIRYYPNHNIVEKTIKQINEVLEEERVPYRIINGLVTPIFQKVEVEEVERVFYLGDEYKPVADCLMRSLQYLSNREYPNYQDSIKASILAIEKLVKIVLGEDSGTLGQLIKKLNIHPALKEAFANLYGWTSDEDGVRHAKLRSPLSTGFEEARFMLVIACAFVNYVIEKYTKESSNE